MEFCKVSPCNNCPYRKDAPLQYWSPLEYNDLLANEKSQFGSVYGCHKNDGNVCVGWLMNQDKRNFPSIALRMALSSKGIKREYLDSLHCKSEQYDTVEEMIKANFPKLKV